MIPQMGFKKAAIGQDSRLDQPRIFNAIGQLLIGFLQFQCLFLNQSVQALLFCDPVRYIIKRIGISAVLQGDTGNMHDPVL